MCYEICIIQPFTYFDVTFPFILELFSLIKFLTEEEVRLCLITICICFLITLQIIGKCQKQFFEGHTSQC